MSIFLGGLAPRFSGATQSNPRFSPGAFGGRYIVLFFLPTDDGPRQSALSSPSGCSNSTTMLCVCRIQIGAEASSPVLEVVR